MLVIYLALAVTAWMELPKIYRYYQPAKPQPLYHIKTKQLDDTIRILFMGDSWAAYHADYDTLLACLICSNTGKPCRVKSTGYVGAKSKEIYECLFTDAKHCIMEHPDYCIVSAGINDAVAKMGTHYYEMNYSQIIRFLLVQRIVPVVLDMPDVDYRAVYERENIMAKLRHNVSSIVTGAEFFSFQTYRTALDNLIEQSGWQDSLVYIELNKWIPEHNYPYLYQTDGIHLNRKGYQKLDSCLNVEISNHRKNVEADN